MNKNLLNIIGILLLSMVAFSFTACSEDDEDNAAKSSKLVGEWICIVDGEIDMIYNFKEDGTGIGKDDPYSEYQEIWYFQYTYNEETGLLIMYCDDGDVEVSSIKFVNDDTFLEYYVNDDFEIDNDDPGIYHRKSSFLPLFRAIIFRQCGKGIYSNSQSC